MEQAQRLGLSGDLEAQVVDQLQRCSGQVHIGLWPLQQHQVATVHGARCSRGRCQDERQRLSIMQGVGVGRWQPGVIEASAEPAFGGFQQALLGHLLNCRMQGQVQFVGGHIARDQFQHHIAAILAALSHQYPIVAAMPMQGQAYRYAQVGQLGHKVVAVLQLDRLAPLQRLGEVQRHADALVGEAVVRGLDMQGQGLEVARVLADQRTRHEAPPCDGPPPGRLRGDPGCGLRWPRCGPGEPG